MHQRSPTAWQLVQRRRVSTACRAGPAIKCAASNKKIGDRVPNAPYAFVANKRARGPSRSEMGNGLHVAGYGKEGLCHSSVHVNSRSLLISWIFNLRPRTVTPKSARRARSRDKVSGAIPSRAASSDLS